MDGHADAGSGIRVGDLASSAGLTVRTLHYFDEVGLLRASQRTAAGHRLYSDADVERLYRICLLRRFGLALEEIAQALDDPAWNVHAVVSTHLRDVDPAPRSRGSTPWTAHPTSRGEFRPGQVQFR